MILEINYGKKNDKKQTKTKQKHAETKQPVNGICPKPKVGLETECK